MVCNSKSIYPRNFRAQVTYRLQTIHGCIKLLFFLNFHREKKHESCLHCCCVVVLVTQSCLTLCYPMDYTPPDSSVYETSQAITLKCVAIPLSRGCFPTQGSKLHPCKWLIYHWAVREALKSLHLSFYSQSESETTEATDNLRWSQSTWQFWLISKIVREGDSKSFSRVSCFSLHHRDRGWMR